MESLLDFFSDASAQAAQDLPGGSCYYPWPMQGQQFPVLFQVEALDHPECPADYVVIEADPAFLNSIEGTSFSDAIGPDYLPLASGYYMAIMTSVVEREAEYEEGYKVNEYEVVSYTVSGLLRLDNNWSK